jgi:hypothetical protein
MEVRFARFLDHFAPFLVNISNCVRFLRIKKGGVFFGRSINQLEKLRECFNYCDTSSVFKLIISISLPFLISGVTARFEFV